MIALATEKQHADEFQRRFRQLFGELTSYARSRGIHCTYALGGDCTREDPEDFAQECLIEYSTRARRNRFCSVQPRLIKRIAHDRLVDAWRKRDRRPNRQPFEASTKELTEESGSISERRCALVIPEFQGLSGKAVEILWLKYVAEWLDREIAETLGMTVDGVRSSLKRSRRTLLAKRADGLAQAKRGTK
jgi:DNA-directed RNA polymerase specialized sigma24 family protein